MGFLWLLFQMLVLMLLSAVGGYFLRKWIERSSYKDVTVAYSKAVGEHKATKKEYERLNTQYLSLQGKVDSKLDTVLGRFSPLENRLDSIDVGSKLQDVEQKVGAVKSLLTSLPKPQETDLSPVLGAISDIKIPEAKAPDFQPVLDAISSIEIPEAKQTDLSPVLAAIDGIRIPQQKETDLNPVLNAVNSLDIPKPTETDLTPVLKAIENIRIPAAEKADLSPVLDAIYNIRIPEKKELNTLPLMSAIRNIKLPEQKEPDLGPVLKAIEKIDVPKPEKTDLAPVLDAIRNIRAPEVKPTDLTPALTAIRNIKIPENKPTDVKPVMDAIKQIRIPEAKATDLSPVLSEIKLLKAELAKRPVKEVVEKKVVKVAREKAPVQKMPSQENKQVIANRLGGRGNRLRNAAFGKPDDLKVISGVGPKLEKMLHGIGVYYYWQVADWTKTDVQEADDLLDAFKGRIDRDDWVKQAGKLAKLTTAAKRP